MRTRAGVLIFNQSKREVLLIKSLNGDRQYYVIPGAAVMPEMTPLTTINHQLETQLCLTPTTTELNYLGEFDYQGNPQHCYTLDAQRYHLANIHLQTNKYQSQWIPYNELEIKLAYLPKLVDAFFDQILLVS